MTAGGHNTQRRILIVHKKYRSEVERLVAGTDVVLVICGGEKAPTGETRNLLQAGQWSSIAYLSVVKPYRKVIEREFGLAASISVESLPGGQSALAEWITGPGTDAQQLTTPRAAFEQAIQGEGRLLLAHGALETADEILLSRYEFANRAASALAKLARDPGIAVGGLYTFFAQEGLKFAPSSNTKARYRLHGSNAWNVSALHLKSGDHTTANAAPRVYFDIHKKTSSGGDPQRYILILRCGPHPKETFSIQNFIEIP